MAKSKTPTPQQISSIRALAAKYGPPLRQHQEKDGTLILHCQRPTDLSAKLFRVEYPDGLTSNV